MSSNRPPIVDSDLGFLAGGGEASRLILARDWSSHPLGPPDTWPESLRTALSLILNSPESMILAWGPELSFFFNETYFPLLGPRLSWAMGARFDAVWADGWEQAKPIIDDAFAGRSARYVNLPWKLGTDRGDEETWWTFSYSRVLDAKGAVAGLFILTQETTDQVRAETASRVAEERRRVAQERLASALEIAQLGTLDWDTVNGMVSVDRRAREIFGLGEQEVVSQEEIFGRIARKDIDRVHAEASAAAASGATLDVEYAIDMPDGSQRVIVSSGFMVRNDEGRPVRMIGIWQDVTESRRWEEALLRQNQELETSVSLRTAERDLLWETSPDLLALLDFEGRLLRVNPAWTRLLGHPPEEILGRAITSLVVPEDVALTLEALEVGPGGAMTTIENRYRHKDGSVHWFSWAAAPTDTAIYATGRDITADKAAQEALRHAEEQLRQSQKVEAMGQLMGGVAHDFNNLLQVIRGSVELLRRAGTTEERRKRYIDAIADTSERAAKLTSQLLAFARRQALRPEVFDVGDSVRAIRDMIGTLAGSRVEIVVELPEAPCVVNADRNQFDTAIVNMAVNARDAMAGEGRLTLRVGTASGLPPARSSGAVAGEFATIAIIDTGIGIPTAAIDRIFEPFFSTKGPGHGTGLGLSQVFGFARQSGGGITVESREGEGATFVLYLPRISTPVDAAPAKPQDPAEEQGSGACVLVVEDNAEVGGFATQALSELGYETLFVQDAKSALLALARAPGRFDVVFSDVVMPGMSGIELGKEILRLYPSLPVLLTSGYSSVLSQSGTHGFELLQKPYSIDALSRALRKVAGVSRP